MDSLIATGVQAVMSSIISGVVVVVLRSHYEKSQVTIEENTNLRFKAVHEQIQNVDRKVDRVEKKVESESSRIDSIRSMVHGIDKKMDVTANKVDSLKAQVEKSNGHYGKVIRRGE